MESDHPDLIDVARRLRRRFDAVLEAEREAAEVIARRTTSLRERLIEVEDRLAEAVVLTTTGSVFEAMSLTVASDHVELRTRSGSVLVTFEGIEAVSLP